MKKKFLSIAGVIISALVILVFYYGWPKNIDKSYYGYCVDLNSREITDTCDISIKGKYKRLSGFDFDFGKIRGKFVGNLNINDLSYDLRGATALNDENEYFIDEEGNKLLSLHTSHSTEKYLFSIYSGFDDEEIFLRKMDNDYNYSNNIIIASDSRDLRQDDIMSILKESKLISFS